MNKSIRVVLALAAATISFAALCADGTRYKWRDANGLVHFSDSVPAEAVRLGYDVVDSQGFVVKHVDRPRSAEEIKADADATATREQTQQRADDALRADQQLLAAYPTEADLAAAQNAKIEALDQTVQNVRVSQSDQEKSLDEQLAHAATFERDNKPVPAPVKQEIEILRKNVEAQTNFIARKQSERAEIERKSATEMAHYRELHAKKSTSTP